jgi:NADH-Ubiquinone/plastoquinone (complex I), various chains.
LKDRKNLYPAESALKYFITQSLASRILLLAIILSLNLKEFFLETFQFLSIIINSALLTKIGAAPFHT